MEKARIRGKDFCRVVGISHSYLSNIKNGRQEPSLSTALDIEDATKGKVKARDLRLSPSRLAQPAKGK